MSVSRPEFILHVWPGRWDLPSIDPSCLAAVLYLQLSIPGKFAISESINPDLSPSGQLPYLTHEYRTVSPLSSIIKYVAGLYPSRQYGNLDIPLSPSENAQRVAWSVHIESTIGDLVAHMFFSINDNWWKLTNLVYASMLPVPQRYYVPGRIREAYKPRLEANRLWNLPTNEPEKKSPFFPKKEEKTADGYVRVFEREKVLEKARSALDIYVRLLGSKNFFYHERPTTLDVLLAAHVLLITIPPFPDPLLQSLLVESYPTIVAHANLTRSHAFPQSGNRIMSDMPSISPPPMYSLWSLIPYPARKKSKPKAEKSTEDARFNRLRWRWIGLAVATLVGYVMLTGANGRAEDDDKAVEAPEGEEGETEEEVYVG